MLYPIKRHFKISGAMVRETPEMLIVAEILSLSIFERLVLEQGRFLKRE